MDAQFTLQGGVVLAKLPQELITEILIRLPQSPFCVSNVFRNLSARSSVASISSILILNKSFEDKSHSNLLFPTSEKFSTNCNSAELEGSALAFRHHVCGYCNGIFLLLHYGDLLVLWNPSTQQQRVLPWYPGRENLNNPNCVRIGLGYDSTQDDHKVVVLEPIQSNDPLAIFEYRVWIFGFRSFSWRKVCVNFSPRVGARSHHYRFGHFGHGGLHWSFGYTTDSYDLVVFDVAKETFSVLAKPDYNLANDGAARLNVLDECLCMSFWPCLVNLEACLYVRKKDGTEFVWSLLYSVTMEQLPPFLNILNFFEMGILGYSSGGDKIMLDLGVKFVVSNDIKEKRFQLTDIEIPTDFLIPARRFIESLVSVAPNKLFAKLFSS